MLTSSAVTPNVTAAVASTTATRRPFLGRGAAGSLMGESSVYSLRARGRARLVVTTRAAEPARFAVADAPVAVHAADRVRVGRRAADDLVDEVAVAAQAVRLQ